jgi:hypothetical protein
MRKLAWPLPTTPEPETTLTLDRRSEYSTTRTKCFGYPPSPPKPVKLLSKYLLEQWTNNKAFKSWMRPDPSWDRCGDVETMEHLLCECMHYSQLLWDRLGDVITRYLNLVSSTYVPKVDITLMSSITSLILLS